MNKKSWFGDDVDPMKLGIDECELWEVNGRTVVVGYGEFPEDAEGAKRQQFKRFRVCVELQEDETWKVIDMEPAS